MVVLFMNVMLCVQYSIVDDLFWLCAGLVCEQRARTTTSLTLIGSLAVNVLWLLQVLYMKFYGENLSA